MKKLTATLGIVTTLFGASFPLNVEAQTKRCNGLQVVEGTGTMVTKQVSLPNLGITKDNWNTDFAVPSNSNFKTYRAKIESRSQKTKDVTVEVFLKYSDGTADHQFRGDVIFPVSKFKEITVTPRRNQQPYQINVKVGDNGSVGFDYALSVVGCNR